MFGYWYMASNSYSQLQLVSNIPTNQLQLVSNIPTNQLQLVSTIPTNHQDGGTFPTVHVAPLSGDCKLG